MLLSSIGRKRKCQWQFFFSRWELKNSSIFFYWIFDTLLNDKKTTIYYIHRKKRFTSFPSPAGMSRSKLPLGRNNSVMTSLFPPRESLVVTSRLGTGNSRTIFYGVAFKTKILFKIECEWTAKRKSAMRLLVVRGIDSDFHYVLYVAL